MPAAILPKSNQEEIWLGNCRWLQAAEQAAAFDPKASKTASVVPCRSPLCACGRPSCGCSREDQCTYARNYGTRMRYINQPAHGLSALEHAGAGTVLIPAVMVSGELKDVLMAQSRTGVQLW